LSMATRIVDDARPSVTISWTVNSVTVAVVLCTHCEVLLKVLRQGLLQGASTAKLHGFGASLVAKAECHFLQADTVFDVVVVAGASEIVSQGRTLASAQGFPLEIARRLPRSQWCSYVGDEHELGPWLAEAPTDWLWTFNPSIPMLRRLWRHACFTLLDKNNPMVQCPNPRDRYCLKLQAGQRWLKNKRVRRHKSDFFLTINKQFSETFQACAEYHAGTSGGTWITPDLILAMDRCRQEASDELRIWCIELWEKASGRLAACIMSLSVGCIFHDYTTATFVRDERSAGSLLARVLGLLLERSGYTLWYWGFKNSYMSEFDAYGGAMIPNREFWNLWEEQLGKESPADLCRSIAPGQTLDLAVL